MIFLIFLLIAFPFTIILVGWFLSTPGYQGMESPHFDGEKFTNLGGIKAKGFKAVVNLIITRRPGKWRRNYESDQGSPPKKSVFDIPVITFINHSTFLIQLNGLNILTDPIWSERCSPFKYLGPKRMRPPGIKFEDLPTIDIVLVSHNHYDHLDLSTLRKIREKYDPTFVTALGIKSFLRKKGFENIYEMDWWQAIDVGVSIHAVPAQHFSSRGLFDRDKSLWCGFVIASESWKIYFAGDSGYGDFFKKIGKKLGPMDVSLIPIGAYKPLWFMSPIHVTPEEAIKIHKDVKSKKSIAMHFGTFALADEGQGEAEQRLILGLRKKDVPQEDFIIPNEGVAIPLS